MRPLSVLLVILNYCCLSEAIREETNIVEIQPKPQQIKSHPFLTSGVHLGDFPLPSYLKVDISSRNIQITFALRAPPWSMVCMADSGGRG